MGIKQMFTLVALVLVTIAAIKSFLPEGAHIGNQNHPASEHKIVIIPMTGIPEYFLASLERKLEEEHGTDVLVTTALGKGDEMRLPNRDQFSANFLADLGLDIAKRIHRQNAFIIVLTNEDINSTDSGLRYVYSAHFDGVSVVSLARINEMNFGVIPKVIEIPSMFNKMQTRALKLINKAIGYGVYGYEASSNIDSVMYGPIMGPEDLDRIGGWY